MKKFIILLLTLIMLLGCRTRKIEVKEEKSNAQESVQVLKESKQSNFEFGQSQQEYNLSSFAFGSNISLKSIDSAQPARITEYREGKPFRSIEVVNATYTENKSVKDSAMSSVDKKMNLKFSNLMTLYNRQNIKIKELYESQEQLKVEGAEMANNFKYTLWFLLLIAVIWIGQSTGLFSVLKRLLKSI